MKTIPGSKRRHYVARVSVFLVTVALIAGMVGCPSPSQNLEIRTWYDLDAITNNLAGNHILMNDLDSTIAGYEELASPTANQGKGWQPIGFLGTMSPLGCGLVGGAAPWWYGLTGTFDGQGYEIRDLFINHPDERGLRPMGLFGSINEGGIIKNLGVVNVTVIGYESVGGLAGWNYYGTVSNCYATGSVTGGSHVGGLLGTNRYGIVSNSYSTGNVTGGSHFGGLMGENIHGTVRKSFWDTETSGQSTSDGGTGKTTAEMKDFATFSGASWNIIIVGDPGERNPAYIWNIVDDETYPFLSWQAV